ncbi:MAG: cytochrome b [Sphingomonadales bacterium]|jgi:cytochrome b561
MNRYSKGAITLHWLMSLLIIGNLLGGFLHDFVPRENGQRAFVMALHTSFGLSLILLTLLRLGWRLAHSPPALPRYFTKGERLLAKAGHWGFYIAMLALPLTGWALTSRGDKPLLYFWLFEVPKFGIDKATARSFGEIHETLGWVMVALLALHIAGLLKHLVLDRDNLLPRMGIGRPRT